MDLITIDGELYIQRTAFSFLLGVKTLNSHVPLMCMAQLEAKAEKKYGSKYKHPYMWTDGYLAEALKRVAGDQATFGVSDEYNDGTLPPIQQDEITVNGIPYADEQDKKVARPDLSPIGVGSITGKVAKELHRRLRIVIAEDRAALHRRRDEGHVTPAPEAEH